MQATLWQVSHVSNYTVDLKPKLGGPSKIVSSNYFCLMSKPKGTVGKSVCKVLEHKILGGLVTGYKSPEQACLPQWTLYLKEHQEIKSPCLLKLWVEWFFVFVRLGGVLLFDLFALFALVGYSVWGFYLFGFNPFRFLYVISSKPTEDFRK